VALVYEARRRAVPRRLNKKMLRRISGPATESVRIVRAAERFHTLDDLTPLPEFGLSLGTWEWSQGCEFEKLETLVDVGPGDVVRNFRLAIQLMRQTIIATKGDVRLEQKLRGAIHRMNRDVVDAERQLRVE